MLNIDTFALNAVSLEIKKILGARVTKIFQANHLDLALTFRLQDREKTLYFSIHPSWARLHFSSQQKSPPKKAPPFCMKLRKHLKGAQLVEIKHPPLERSVSLAFSTRNEEGKLEILWLHAEIMGKHSNVILSAGENSHTGIILEALKHVDREQSSIRPIFPGQPFTPPPPQNKLHFFYCTESDLKNALEEKSTQSIEKALVSSLAGINSFWAKEIAARAGLKIDSLAQPVYTEKLWPALQSLLRHWQQQSWEPSLALKLDGSPYYPSALKPYATFPERWKPFAAMSTAIETLFETRQQELEEKTSHDKLMRWLTNAYNKAEKKENMQLKELQKTKKAEEYKLYGELLLTAGEKNKSGAEFILLTNFYNTKEKVKIPLDPSLSLKENSHRYFRLYKKAKTGKEKIIKQLQRTREELSFLKGLIDRLAEGKPSEQESIWEELKWRGYLLATSKRKGTSAQKQSSPYRFYSSSGLTIMAGRNSKQNDYLTFNVASKDDYWLHAKNLAGAHVIIKNTSPDQKSLEEASLLAAWLSKAKNSANVPVDYTRVRFVKKMPGGKPGQVIYENFKTLFVTPDKELFKRLQEIGDGF